MDILNMIWKILEKKSRPRHFCGEVQELHLYVFYFLNVLVWRLNNIVMTLL